MVLCGVGEVCVSLTGLLCQIYIWNILSSYQSVRCRHMYALIATNGMFFYPYHNSLPKSMKLKVCFYGNSVLWERRKSARTFNTKIWMKKFEQWENIDARQHKNNDVPLFECFLCSKKKTNDELTQRWGETRKNKNLCSITNGQIVRIYRCVYWETADYKAIYDVFCCTCDINTLRNGTPKNK